jgi:hypothetical protein
MIKKLSFIFGSKTKAQEIIYLLKDIKEVVRQGFYEEELPQIEKYCNENNIHLVKSKFKVLLADEQNYTNKGIRVPEKDKRKGMKFVYFSKNEQKAWLAAYYELVANDQELGLLLGYPKCCVECFCKKFNSQNTNLELKSENVWTNLSKRKKDMVILSHFPCGSNCQESINLAKKYFQTIEEVDTKHAQELIKELDFSTSF